jgi:hypothetical protein
MRAIFVGHLTSAVFKRRTCGVDYPWRHSAPKENIVKTLVLVLALSFGAMLTVSTGPVLPTPQTGPIGAPQPCAPCH